MIAGHILGGS